jgi:hypothetical protein
MSVRNSEMEKLVHRISPEITDDIADEIADEIEQQDDVWADSADESTEITEADDTAIFEANSENSDNVGNSSVQLDVAQLLAEVEAEASKGVDANGRVRRRLEAIMERKRRHQDLLDFEDYDLDS